MSKKTSTSLTDKQAKDVIVALEVLFASGYVNKKKLYIANFWRGMAFSIGGIIGATIGIGVILWGLSLFNEVPLIGEITKNIQQTIDQNQ